MDRFEANPQVKLVRMIQVTPQELRDAAARLETMELHRASDGEIVLDFAYGLAFVYKPSLAKAVPSALRYKMKAVHEETV